MAALHLLHQNLNKNFKMKNMKTRIAFSVTTSIIALMLSYNLNAQSNNYTVERQFDWDGESKTETIYVEIKEKSTSMMVNMTGTVKKGKLEVNIYDPDGEKVPAFLLVADDSASAGNSSISVSNNGESNTVVTSSSSSGSSSSNSTSISSDKKGTSTFTTTSSAGSGSKGVMSKMISDPLAGKWKIVISARKLTGELDVNIEQD